MFLESAVDAARRSRQRWVGHVCPFPGDVPGQLASLEVNVSTRPTITQLSGRGARASRHFDVDTALLEIVMVDADCLVQTGSPFKVSRRRPPGFGEQLGG